MCVFTWVFLFVSEAMPRQRKTTKYNLINVPQGFVDQRGNYLGSITVVGLDSPAKNLRFYANRWLLGQPHIPKSFLGYNEAKQYLIDGKQ